MELTRETVIKALECCRTNSIECECSRCPLKDIDDCDGEMNRAALNYLQEKEPEQLSPEESRKSSFVNNELCNLLKSANDRIECCCYSKQDCVEVVSIEMINGYTYNIDITGDGLMTIVSDVCRYLIYK
ncbi:MAG: hypothetical protein Q4D35_03205 [Ruminococcus sp.]|nr:hypothetical protein [Ruminococcus sp.]